ncbi:MAG: DUF3307 domain-containing protein [Methylophilaceae bacterium]
MTGEYATANTAFLPLLCLFIKHFICDFPLQANPWMYRNKGTYLHLGGIAHAALHGVGTLIALIPFVGLEHFMIAAAVAGADMLVHYHIDWAKMNINAKLSLKPDNSEWFWISLGFDQLLHHLTYFAIVYYVFIR